MPNQDKNKVTAEALKELLRRYADDNHPEWVIASISIRIGRLGEHTTETLVTRPEKNPPQFEEDRQFPV